jgi:hypothetical protein
MCSTLNALGNEYLLFWTRKERFDQTLYNTAVTFAAASVWMWVWVALYCTAGCFSPLLVRRSHGAFGDVCGSNSNAILRIEVAVAFLNQISKILSTILAFHTCQSTHFIHITADLAQLCCAGNEWNEGYSLLEYGPVLIVHLLLTFGELCCFRFHGGRRNVAVGVASFYCTLVTNEHWTRGHMSEDCNIYQEDCTALQPQQEWNVWCNVLLSFTFWRCQSSNLSFSIDFSVLIRSESYIVPSPSTLRERCC